MFSSLSRWAAFALILCQSLAAMATGGNCLSSYSFVGVSMASQSLRNLAESAEIKKNNYNIKIKQCIAFINKHTKHELWWQK